MRLAAGGRKMLDSRTCAACTLCARRTALRTTTALLLLDASPRRGCARQGATLVSCMWVACIPTFVWRSDRTKLN